MSKLRTKLKNTLGAVVCLALWTLPAAAYNEKWHLNTLTYKTLGRDVNNFYHVVGLPKNCICQFMAAQPAFSNQGHDFFYVAGHPKIFLEAEYSNDGNSIAKFRFIEKSQNNDEEKFGGWQTKNTRERRGEFLDGLSIVYLDRAKDFFAMPFGSSDFTSEKWKEDQQARYSFLFDIAHDYPIIGMKRTEVISVLGQADYNAQILSDTNLEFDLADKYSLDGGCLDVGSYLQIAYNDNKVVAFRVVDSSTAKVQSTASSKSEDNAEFVSYGSGSGRSEYYIPGNSDEERWSLIQKNLSSIASGTKKDVLFLLGPGFSTYRTTQGKVADIWTYRITGNSKKKNLTDIFYELKIEFLNQDIVSMKVTKSAVNSGLVGDPPSNSGWYH